MLFNSFQFAIFFIVVYGLYLGLNHRRQNFVLLAASFVFYGAWDPIFLLLLLATTIIDYICAIQIAQAGTPTKKKIFLLVSIVGNLAILGYFKYFNFFADSLQRLLAFWGIQTSPACLDVILPIGISFYTFQTMSYTIDVYRGLLKPCKCISDFSLYVTFFPQLVAGPIERATRLLPQVLQPRTLSLAKFYEGAYLIFWGLFKKVFVADNLAGIADPVFASSGPYAGAQVLWAVYAFTIQIYCDFSGYSDIARGLAKCMGFELMLNFNLPYFVTNPRELWQRWHISLSTWVRDYVFKPLGGYTRGLARSLRNVLITFFLIGLWHGANWTFVVWGVYHGILLAIYILMLPLLGRVPNPRSPTGQILWLSVRIVFFFHLFCLGALVFRAPTVAQAWEMLKALVFHFDVIAPGIADAAGNFVFYSWTLLAVQGLQFLKKNLDVIWQWPAPARAAFYVVCFYLLLIFGVQGAQQFYYFQF